MRRALWLAAFSFAARASAQPAPTDEEPPCAAEVRDDFARASRLYEDRQYASAAQVFEPLLERCETPRILFYLGAAWRASGRVQAAIAVWERYLGAGGVAHAQDVRRDLAELRSARVGLDLRVTPAEATVAIDGREYPARATPRFLDPVAHVLVVSAPGHSPYRQEVPARRGGVVTLAVALSPSNTTGQLTVEPSVPGAVVRVNGVRAGLGRVTRTLAPGTYYLEVSAPAFDPWRRSVTVERGGILRVDASLTRPSRTQWVLPTALAGGAALAIGIVASVLWFSRGIEAPIEPSGGVVRLPSE